MHTLLERIRYHYWPDSNVASLDLLISVLTYCVLTYSVLTYFVLDTHLLDTQLLDTTNTTYSSLHTTHYSPHHTSYAVLAARPRHCLLLPIPDWLLTAHE